jgi:hypothetical protein
MGKLTPQASSHEKLKVTTKQERGVLLLTSIFSEEADWTCYY